MRKSGSAWARYSRPKRQRRGDAQTSLRAIARLRKRSSAKRFGLFENAAGAGERAFACLGERETACGAVEELDAEPLLQFRDLLGDGGFGETHLLGGGGKSRPSPTRTNTVSNSRGGPAIVQSRETMSLICDYSIGRGKRHIVGERRTHPMIEKRPFDSLGQFENDWLKARYHFSFSGYRDPNRMSWGALRVWNDDIIKAKTGFPPRATPTWRSSLTSAPGRSRTRIRWAIRAAPKRATCR